LDWPSGKDDTLGLAQGPCYMTYNPKPKTTIKPNLNLKPKPKT